MNQLFNIFKVDSAKDSRIMASSLCISAHWETKGTYVTTMQNPPTIHDFGGFPKALFEVHGTGKSGLSSEGHFSFQFLLQRINFLYYILWHLRTTR